MHKKTEKIDCTQCSKKFLIEKYLIKQNKKRFCSNECKGKYQSKHFRGENHPRFNSVKCVCKNCNKNFLLSPAHIKNGEGKFCTRSCFGKWMSKNLIKNKARNWQGGISLLYSKYSGDFRVPLKEKIKSIYNYTCQYCGITKNELPPQRALAVHHKDLNGKNNNYNNLICVCDSCHKKIHVNRLEQIYA